MKRTNLNLSVKVLVVFAFFTVFLSCKKKEDVIIVNGNAKFRLVNAFQGSAAQDFYQGDTKVSTTSVAYGQASDLLTVKAGSTSISFKPFGTQEVSASENVGINSDMNYTVFYIKNSLAKGEIIGYPETTATPPTGKVGVRFLNAGANLTTGITLSLANGDALTTSLVFGGISNYLVLDPAAELKFTISGQTVSSSIPASTFQTDKIYTVWFDSVDGLTAQYHLVKQ